MVSLSAINGDAVTGLRKSRLSRLQQGTAGGRESGRLIQGVLLFFGELCKSASDIQRNICMSVYFYPDHHM